MFHYFAESFEFMYADKFDISMLIIKIEATTKYNEFEYD